MAFAKLNSMKFVGLGGLSHFWSKAKTLIMGQITAEVTARENADTALQQSITDLEASVDEKIGSIDISAALSHIKQYDFVVDSNETLLAWANCTDGSMKSVLVKSGEYTLDGKMINLVNAGTKFVFAEDGNKITVSNYMRGIGATEDYGAVIIGLNVESIYSINGEDCYAFYRGMICYNCTGTGTKIGNWSGEGFYECTCYNCTGTGTNSNGDGFESCVCSNCTGTSTAYNGSGFYKCTCSNCTGTGNGEGFYKCTCSNCTGFGSKGFNSCTCSNCTGEGTGVNGFSNGYGFNNCTCSNCTGFGRKGTSNKGYGFYDCKHCSSCRVKAIETGGAAWGGTNTYIDSDSCNYVAA